VFDVSLSGAERVRVLLELINDHQSHRNKGRTIPVELNAGNIEKLT